MDFDLTLWNERQEAERSTRLARYKRNYSYYMGEQRQPLPVRPGQANDNVIINLCRMVVDKGVSFLFGKELTWELTEGDQTPEEDRLDEIWRANSKMSWLGKLGLSGAIYGHMFVKIIPQDARGAIDYGTPRLILLEPENVEVEWDPQDYEVATRYVVSWTSRGSDGKPWHYRQIVEHPGDSPDRWQILNRRSRGSEHWEPDPANPDILNWPYTWPPIADAQNLPCPGAYYGLSDIEDLDEQDALNYVASKVQRIIRYHSHPKTWARGVGKGDLRVNEDEIAILNSDSAALQNLEMQSDLGASLTFMDRLRNLFMRQARVPDLDPATMNVGAMSGFALQVLYSDLLDKTEMKRRTYGDLIIELNRRLLDLSGMGDDNYVTLHWDNPLPTDEEAERVRDEFELDNKLVSRETVQRRRGIDPEVERERMDAEQAATGNVGEMLIRGFLNGNQPGQPRPVQAQMTRASR